MISAKISDVVILLVWFSVSSNCQCPARDCDVTSWTFWSRCTSDQCGQLGAQSRSRMIITRPTCGGRECPDNFYQTRRCYGGNPVDCELSQWTHWSSCTTPCSASGIQSSSRHRITTEGCGGTCLYPLTRTRSCLQISCFNGEVYKMEHVTVEMGLPEIAAKVTSWEKEIRKATLQTHTHTRTHTNTS